MLYLHWLWWSKGVGIVANHGLMPMINEGVFRATDGASKFAYGHPGHKRSCGAVSDRYLNGFLVGLDI